MAGQTPDDLRARLLAVRQRAIRFLRDLQAHGASIQDVRQTLGNPFFYSAQPTDDPHSKAKFTGYASHEPALRLMIELREAWTEIQAINHELRAVGLDPD
jgi:hypothetical protein